MKHFFLTFAAVLAAQVFLACALLFFVMGMGAVLVGTGGAKVDVPARACLVQEIPEELVEYEPAQRIPLPHSATITQTMILENLEKARLDDRIQAVVLKFDVPGGGWGKLEEIRQRVHQLREAGKPVYAFTSFAFSPSLHLAAACDSIVLAPEGMVWLTGLMAERFFVKALFDDVGIDVQAIQIGDYKSAAEMFTRESMSPPARANAHWVMEDLYDQFLAAVARDRGVLASDVEGWLAGSPYSPPEAHAAGIVDALLYWDEFMDRLEARHPGLETISAREYASVPRGRFGLRGPKIAVVHGQGMITAGESGGLYPMGLSMGDETIVAALEDLRDDDGIEGVLLRLDTPGGLGLASDRIGEMVADVSRVKPIVVSSVDLNASGGYMVSYRADEIVALPGSVVGSIGALSMRPVLAGVTEKLGITFDRVTKGPNATLFSPVVPLDDQTFARFTAVQRSSYERWIAGVADAREMSPEEVESLAGGRVFTGRQAFEHGLVDAVGGFDEALARLKRACGIGADEPVTLLHYPVRKSFLEHIRAGEWAAVGESVALRLGLRSREELALRRTLRALEAWLRGEETLALHPGAYR